MFIPVSVVLYLLELANFHRGKQSRNLKLSQTIKVGTVLWTEYGKLCEDIDFVLACNVTDGFLPNCYSSTTDFGAMILRIQQGT